MKVKAIVTEAKSYDVLVGSTVLYPMGFNLFEFLLVILLTYLLSLALWMQCCLGLWKLLMKMLLLLTFICK
jgi:hypothetical protein